MNTLCPYTMLRVEGMHYIPIASSGWNECTRSLYNVQGRMTRTTSLFNVQGRMNALRPYTLFQVE